MGYVRGGFETISLPQTTKPHAQILSLLQLITDTVNTKFNCLGPHSLLHFGSKLNKPSETLNMHARKRKETLYMEIHNKTATKTKNEDLCNSVI